MFYTRIAVSYFGTMKALFIGRFQPFHKGHLQMIIRAAHTYDEVIIGIGSSQYSQTGDNPFSAEERKTMTTESLMDAGIKNYQIVFIPDIHNPPKWVDHVLFLVPHFDVVLSNNPLTKQLFSEKGYVVQGLPFFKKHLYSGEEIRRRMRCGESWERLVPEPVANLILHVHGKDRLKQLPI